MPERIAQVEDPAALPPPERRMGPARWDRGAPAATGAPDLAQVAGALAALARRVEAVERPKVTAADRSKALEQAREFVTELALPLETERVYAELAVARYLTGE
jgi:stage V sporulation protein SpoVS